jgi:hypothetical protein
VLENDLQSAKWEWPDNATHGIVSAQTHPGAHC